jgi:NADPH-dependent 2,4-dienoyl-CoA reductase/sulfur reductase-like enzyme
MVTIIGGGFIGIEVAEQLNKQGKRVTVIEKAPHILSNFDTDVVFFMETLLRTNGIQLRLNVSVSGFELNKDEDAITAVKFDGESCMDD